PGGRGRSSRETLQRARERPTSSHPLCVSCSSELTQPSVHGTDSRAMSEREPDKPTSPHDALFKAVFATPEHMAEELRVALPEAVVANIDLTSLTPVPGSFTDANLMGAESDMLFAA